MSFGCCGEISAGSEFIIHTHFCTIHGRFSRNILKDSSAEKFLDILPFHWVALGVKCSIWPLVHFGRASLVLMTMRPAADRRPVQGATHSRRRAATQIAVTMLGIINFQRGNHYVGIDIASHQRHILFTMNPHLNPLFWTKIGKNPFSLFIYRPSPPPPATIRPDLSPKIGMFNFVEFSNI